MSNTPFSQDNWGLRQQKLDQEAHFRDTMKRVAEGGVPARTDGMHFGTGTVVAGVVIAFVLWFPLQVVGLNPLWSIPAGGLGIVVAGALTNRGRSGKRQRSGPRVRRPMRSFTMLGAILGAGLGLWFAVSEGDIPLLRAGLTFGALGAGVGLVVGGVVRFRRATQRRRTT